MIYITYAEDMGDVLNFLDYLYLESDDLKWVNIIKQGEEYSVCFYTNLSLQGVKDVLETVEGEYPFSYVQKMIDTLKETNEIPLLPILKKEL